LKNCLNITFVVLIIQYRKLGVKTTIDVTYTMARSWYAA